MDTRRAHGHTLTHVHFDDAKVFDQCLCRRLLLNQFDSCGNEKKNWIGNVLFCLCCIIVELHVQTQRLKSK